MKMMSRAISMILLLAAMTMALAAQGAVRGVTLPDYETVELENGMTVLLMERHDVPLIALHAMIRGGQTADPERTAGTSELLADLLSKGAGKRDAQEFSEAVDSVGGKLGVRSSAEAVVLSAEFMSRDASLMLELVSDLLLRPALSKDELAKVRSRSIDAIAAAKDSNPNGLMAAYFLGSLYGDHPYGRTADETSLASITIDDVRKLYASHIGPDRTVMALVGDFKTKTMTGQVRRAFGSWKEAEVPVPSIPEPKPAKGRRVLLVDKPDATQTYFWIGNLGVARNDPDRVVLDVANTAFGGRFTSMLNTELRIKTGLSYGARSLLIQNTQPGPVAITSFTKTESTEEALDRALAVLETFRGSGLDEETLASVQAYVAGQFPPDLETGTQLAAKLTEIAFYGLGDAEVNDYAKKVAESTTKSTKRVIDRVYPAADEMIMVLLGNADAIRETAKKYGDVMEMKISAPQFRKSGTEQ